MKKFKYKTKDYIVMAFMVSLGIVLQIADNMLNFIAIPGGKLGLSNIVTLKNIFVFGGINALFISFIRAVLGSFLYGGVTSFFYSVFGALFSVLSMWVIKKFLYPKVSEIGISVVGAFFHNFAQVLVAIVAFESFSLISYLAPLTLLSVFAGIFTGMQVKLLNEKNFKR